MPNPGSMLCSYDPYPYSTAGAVQWVDRPGTVRRCAFADDGSLVALAGQSLFVYGPGGGELPRGGGLG